MEKKKLPEFELLDKYVHSYNYARSDGLYITAYDPILGAPFDDEGDRVQSVQIDLTTLETIVTGYDGVRYKIDW